MEEQVLRSQIDLCLFPAFQLATSVTSLSLTIVVCKVGITVTDHLLWIWLIVSTRLHQTWHCFQVKSPRWQGVRCYSIVKTLYHIDNFQNLSSVLFGPSLGSSQFVSKYCCSDSEHCDSAAVFPFQQGPPDLAAEAAPDLPCTPTLSSTAPAGIPGTWDHGN